MVPKKTTLQESSKLELIRYVSGEFAKAAKSCRPAKKDFCSMRKNRSTRSLLERAVATHGAAVHAGEQVQITKLEFRDHTIVVDVNGGGRGRTPFSGSRADRYGRRAPTDALTATEAQQ